MSGSPPMSDEISDTLPDGVTVVHNHSTKDWIDPLMNIVRDAIAEKTGNTPDSFQVLEITASVARLINQHLDPLGAASIAISPITVAPTVPPMLPRAPGEVAALGSLPSDSEQTPKPPPYDTKIQMQEEV